MAGDDSNDSAKFLSSNEKIHWSRNNFTKTHKKSKTLYLMTSPLLVMSSLQNVYTVSPR